MNEKIPAHEPMKKSRKRFVKTSNATCLAFYKIFEDLTAL